LHKLLHKNGAYIFVGFTTKTLNRLLINKIIFENKFLFLNFNIGLIVFWGGLLNFHIIK